MRETPANENTDPLAFRRQQEREERDADIDQKIFFFIIAAALAVAGLFAVGVL